MLKLLRLLSWSGAEKSQAGIEALAALGFLILFFIASYLLFLNEQSVVSTETNFLKARQTVLETSLLINAASRAEGYYLEFQVPLILPSFSVRLGNYSVDGLLEVGGRTNEISYPINATVYCGTCLLQAGTYWILTKNGVVVVGSK